MDRADKIARQRLAVLQLADRLGNAAEACRRSGVDRTSFYQWKGRFARDGVEGLRNRPPVHKSHPQATPSAVARRIVALGLEHPSRGCDRIEKELARHGIDVSAVTIQKILHKAALGTYSMRWLALEARYAQGGKLSREQAGFLEQLNPCFRERNEESARAGETLCLGTFFLGRFDGAGAVHAHALVDSYSSYAFATLAATAAIEPSLAALREKALPFFAARGMQVGTVLTGKSTDERMRMLAAVLGAHGIAYAVRGGDGANGFIERFRRTAVEEFLRQPSLRARRRMSLERLQHEFDAWLLVYNQSRPHLGYRNYGKAPIELL